MFLFAKSKRPLSSRSQIAIKEVVDGVLSLPGHRYRMVIEVSPLNFELKSEAEQDALIETYESFLNSLGQPLQVLVRTREIDMDKYLSELSERLATEPLPIYQAQLRHYNNFIRSLIASNKILTRHFYVIVPYDARASVELDIVKEQLSLNIDIVAKGLARLGMSVRQLSSLETLDLFYSFYSPIQAKSQPLSSQLLGQLHRDYIEKETVHA